MAGIESIWDRQDDEGTRAFEPSWGLWEPQGPAGSADSLVLGPDLRPLDRDATPRGSWTSSADPPDGEPWVVCPMCRVRVPRQFPSPALRTLASFGLALVGILAGTGLAKYVGALPQWLGYLVPVLVGLIPLVSRLTRHLSLPEDCPSCGGPLRMAVLSDWEGADWPGSPYMQPRWRPQD